MAYHLSANNFKWLSPFDNRSKLAALCTQDNRQLIMDHSGISLLYRLFRHDVLCWPEIEHHVPSRHIALVWFMQALQYCEVNRILNWKKPEIQYNRTFQILITRAAFALVCQQTNDIGLYGLMEYADLFKMLFEDNNTDRSTICQQIRNVNKKLFQRCLTDKPNDKLRLLIKMCSGHSTMRLLRMKELFQRFARNCHTLHEFAINILPKYSSFGEALSNDTYFMHLLSNYLLSTINNESQLLKIVLKTRFHLQLFSITAIKLQRQLNEADVCVKQREKQQFILEYKENDDKSNSTDNTDNDDNDKFKHCSYQTNLFINSQISAEIRNIAWYAEIGLYAETFLLLLVLIITVTLLLLLWKSHKHLSTAMVLFIFNIAFSNTLFIISFIFLFSQTVNEKSNRTLDDANLDGTIPASLAITETMNAYLFEANQFIQQLIQDTLYSLAQNGSLLGLTNLLVLVLVVINRSMAGKSMRLSRTCVISIFSFVWIFLFITHLLFSSLQLTAIHFIGQMFSTLKRAQPEVQCNEIRLTQADYNVLGYLCDRISLFHKFGLYLLRGHTLFTLVFLGKALFIFIVTVCYHRNVRQQSNVLSVETREYKPQRRREILFNTLLLSICAYFISIAGQTFVEIAVFWAEDNEDATKWARWFQLARITAFVNPLFNPLLVTLRIPAMNAKLRCIGQNIANLALPFYYCKRAKRNSKQKRILPSDTGISPSAHIIHSDNFFNELLCYRSLLPKLSYRRRNRTAGIAIRTGIRFHPEGLSLVLRDL